MAFRNSTVSELRIVLLGENSAEISRVGNFILGRDAFDTESLHPTIELHSERASGNVEGRYITLINTPQLLNPQLSPDQVIAQFQECLYLSAPGPHAFLLVLQSGALKKEDEERMRSILGGPFMKYTIILSPQEGAIHHAAAQAPRDRKRSLHLVIRKSERGQKEQVVQLLEKIDELVKLNGGGHLTCNTNELPEAKEKLSRKESMRNSSLKHVRIVLLGENVSEISRVGNCILGRNAFDTETPPPSVEQHSERARGTVERTYITIINTPHLFNAQLSVEEVSLRVKECMTLCAPGPHAFLLVLQPEECTLIDWDQMKTALNLYSDTTLQHTAVLTTQKQGTGEDPHKGNQLVQEIVKKSGGRHYQFHKDSTSSDLLMDIDKIMKNRRFPAKSSVQEEPCGRDWRKTATKNKEMTRGRLHLTPSTANETKTYLPKTLRIILLGKTGAGKSATGNTIFGQEDLFKEDVSGESVTTMCQKETTEINERVVTVIDTPGLFDAPTSNVNTRHEISKTITMAAPGPHAFLLVVPIGRHNQDVNETLKMIQNVFGDDSTRYTMVLFTRGDDLRKKSIDQFIENSGQHTKNLIGRCGNRYHVFNNRNPDDRDQVTALLKKIDSMVAMNGGSCYTNEKFQQAEKALQEEQERTLKEKEEENKETEIMMTNIEIQRQQQQLWHRRQMLKHNVQQEHDGTLREGSPEETEKNPLLV